MNLQVLGLLLLTMTPAHARQLEAMRERIEAYGTECSGEFTDRLTLPILEHHLEQWEAHQQLTQPVGQPSPSRKPKSSK